MMIGSSKVTMLFASVMSLMLAGCASVATQSHMSSTVFLEPVSPEKRIVYVRVRSTADRRGIDLDAAIRRGIREAGYRITDDPAKAHFLFQANVLKIGEFDPDQVRNFLAQGPTSLTGTAAGVVTGLAVADELGDRTGATAGAVAAGLVAAAIVEGIANLVYDEKLYAIITDVELGQRIKGGIAREQAAATRQGDSAAEVQYREGKTDWLKFRTRVVSTARAVNTPWEEVAVQLQDGLSQSIGGML